MPPAKPPTNRVVMIMRHFTVGGLERVLLSQVRVLLSAGYEVTVCVLLAGRGNTLVAELPPGATVVTAPCSRLSRIFFLARLVRGATVLLEFGDGRLYPTIRPALFAARTVVRICQSDYSHLRTRAKDRLDRFLARFETSIVAVGGRSNGFLLDDVGVPAAKVSTLINAMEPRSAAVHAPPWRWARDPYLVSIQSLFPHKGHNALLHAFAKVVAHTNEPVRLVIIGDGDQTIPLRLLADRLGITERIVWLGAVWNMDMVDTVLAGATAFVSMSRFEGVPVSILEARQHGLPLVLTDIPGHRDGAATAPATFVPVDGSEAFANAVLAIVAAGRPQHGYQPDTKQLAEEWDAFHDNFLAIVEAASRS